MIQPEDFAGVGFTDTQIAALVRAFDRIDLASAQRFNTLQDQINRLTLRLDEVYAELRQAIDLTRKAMDDGFERMDLRFDRIEALLRGASSNGGTR
jgi:hypothetical protein